MSLDLSQFTDFIAAHRAWTLPLIFLVSFAESFAFVSILVPGTAILMACGALVPGGTVPLAPLLAGAIAGAVMGDGVSYWIGRRYGETLIRSWPMSRYPKMVSRGEAFLQRHGVLSVGIGRFCGPVRAVVPLVAGIANMDPRRFWAANVVSAVVWAPVILLPGALLGWAADSADATERWMLVGVVAAVAAAATAFLIRRRRTPMP